MSKRIFVILLILCFVFSLGFKAQEIKANDDEENMGLSLDFPRQPIIGEQVNLQAQPTGFEMSYREGFQYIWCVEEMTFQGVAAGSEDEFIEDPKGSGKFWLQNKYGRLMPRGCAVIDWDESDHDKTENQRTDLYRKFPKIEGGKDNDVDNDGMHDQWEIKYFGRYIGKPGPFLNANLDSGSPKYLPRLVDPNGDFDGDGFNWDKTHYWIENEDKREDGDPKYSRESGVPYARDNTTGDGNFTNYEEFVFGTDPTNPDTDRDGILDEADVSGLGQQRCSFKTKKDISLINKKIGVRTIIFAKFREGGWTTSHTHALKQDSGTMSLSAGEPLKVILTPEPKVPTQANTGDDYPKVKVKAEVTGAEQKERLYFKWYLGGKIQEDTSGYNKDVLEFSMDDVEYNEPCNYLAISCDVSEEGTGRMGSAELKLEVGENITQYYTELIGTRAAEEGPVEDPCGPNVDVNSGFVRVGDIIKVHPTLILCPGNPDSDKPEDFIYQWYLDGKEQTDQSGQGDTHQDFTFTVTKSPGDEHLVKLKLIRITDGFEYGQLGEKVFTVQIPTAPISTPELGQPGSCDEIGSGGVCRVIIEPNETQTVDFKTILENFQPTYAPSFRYAWTFDGEVPRDSVTDEVMGVACGGEINDEEGYCESLIAGSTLTYEFAHPGEIEEETVETHTIGLTVENYVYATGGPHETATDTYTVEVVLKTAIGVGRGPVTRLFAQAGGAISSYFKNIFNIVLSLGIIGFIVFVVMAAGEVKKRK